MKRLFYLFLLGSLYWSPALGQDLVVKELDVPSGNGSVGGSAYLRARIANIGENFADFSYVGFYLSKDTTLTFADRFIGQTAFVSLNAGVSDSIGNYFTLPSDIVAGSYYLFAFADYTGLVFEANESNNSKYVPLIISEPFVDLTISSLNVSAASIVSGGYVSATAFIYNNGNSVSAGSGTGYYLSKDTLYDGADILLTNTYVSSVYPGSYATDYASFYIPTSVDTGSYYIIAKADDGNTNIESNEENNLAYTKISIVPERTDLSVLSLVSSNILPVPGSYINPVATVVNAGTTFLSNVTIGYFLSQDSVYSIGDTYLSLEYLGYLYPGSAVNSYPSLFIPTNVPKGNYYILAVVDNGNNILEDNEDNNVKALSIKISEPSVDLSIYGFSVNPSSVVAGTYIYPQIYEFNSGNSYAGSHSVGYYLSVDSVFNIGDTYLSGDYVWGVSSQSYVNLYPSLFIPGSVPNGNYYLLAVADNSYAIEETNENNNVQFVPISVVPASVDLVVSFSNQDSLSWSAGASVNVNIIDKNQGTTLADSHYIGYFLSADEVYDSSDTYLGSNYGYPLKAGDSTYFSLLLNIPTYVGNGSYYVLAVTDYTSFVNETNEVNNTAAVKAIIQSPSVDLTASILSVDSSIIEPGRYIYATVAEYNNGTTNVGGHYIGYYLSSDSVYDGSDTQLAYEYIDGITAGSTTYLYPSLLIPSYASGNYYLLAIADNFSQVFENNENNNTAFRSIFIQVPSVDLSIYNLNLNATSVSAGSYVYPSLYNFNQGTGYAGFHSVGYYLSADSIYDAYDLQLTNDYVYGINPQSYTYLTPSLYIPAYVNNGNYYLIAVTDIYGNVSESNENNNYSIVPLKVQLNGADLSIGNLSASNTNLTAGSFIYVDVKEDNIGNVAANSHHIGFFLSKDSTYDESDVYLDANYVSGLNGGAGFLWHPALYLPGSTPDGVYYVIAVGDYGNVISEIIEYNNTKALRIIIGNPVVGPDVFVTSIYGFADSLPSGTSQLVKFSEVNNGTEWAGEHYTTFYLSHDSIRDGNDPLIGSEYISGGISPGGYYEGSVYLSINATVAPGHYYLIAWADASEYVAEVNESNNEFVRPITIGYPIITGGLTKDFENQDVNLYPNPSTGIVHFNSVDNLDAIEVTDVNGHFVTSQKASSLADKTLDLQNLGAGVYVVKTKKEGTVTSTHKLVITK